MGKLHKSAVYRKKLFISEASKVTLGSDDISVILLFYVCTSGRKRKHDDHEAPDDEDFVPNMEDDEADEEEAIEGEVSDADSDIVPQKKFSQVFYTIKQIVRLHPTFTSTKCAELKGLVTVDKLYQTKYWHYFTLKRNHTLDILLTEMTLLHCLFCPAALQTVPTSKWIRV